MALERDWKGRRAKVHDQYFSVVLPFVRMERRLSLASWFPLRVSPPLIRFDVWESDWMWYRMASVGAEALGPDRSDLETQPDLS